MSLSHHVVNTIRYQGGFRNGLKHGYGTYYYPNGQSFVGNYRVSRRNARSIIMRVKRSQHQRGGDQR